MDGFDHVVVHSVELSPGSVAAAVYESEAVDVWCLHSQAPSKSAQIDCASPVAPRTESSR